jgi:pimeloyl-ACP methyl ester carboxylesterase
VTGRETDRAVVTDGVRLAVRAWTGDERETGRNRRPSILLLHGLASTSHIWDLVAPRLAGEFRVVAYDQRGHGRSSKPTSGYGFASMTADAAAVIGALRLGRPVVVGHSWGANVALELAVRRSRSVGGCILLDGGFLSLRDRMDWRTTRELLSPPALAGMSLESFRRGIRTELGSAVEVTPEIEAAIISLVRVDRVGRIRPRLARANHLRILRAMWAQDPLELLRSVRVPTLVLAARTAGHAGADEAFTEAKRQGSAAVRAIGAPLRFEWIGGIHDVPLQRPAAVATRIARFAREAVR